MMAKSFSQVLEKEARAVEAALELLLPPAAARPAVMHEAMRYSALEGGKRLRGILVREAARLGQDRTDVRERAETSQVTIEATTGGLSRKEDGGAAAAPGPITITPELMRKVGGVDAVSAAVEMIHAYSLVHDDLPAIDDDDLRRGRPTTHKVYGEGMAVLAGDALLTRAFEVLARLPWAGVAPEVALAVLGEFAVAGGTAGIIGGQVVDIEAEGSLRPEAAVDTAVAKETLEYIHTHKTGALFRACLRSGAILGGLDESELERVSAYADALGVAFQITDDLLDVEGDAKQLGKRVGSDERKGKLTYPALYGLEVSRQMAKEQVEKAVDAIRPFGDRARFLRELIEFVYERKH